MSVRDQGNFSNASIYAKTALMALMSVITAGAYYASSIHVEAAGARTAFLWYLLLIFVLWSTYRAYLFFTKRKEVSFTPLALIAIILGNIFLLTLFFPFTGLPGGSLVLFGKILKYLLLPSTIIFITSAFGGWSLKKIFSKYSDFSHEVKAIASISVGLSLYLFLLSILGNVFPYNFLSTFLPLIGMLAVARREALEIGTSMVTRKYTFPILASGPSGIIQKSFALLSAEFFFFVIAFLIAVNFVNVVRPMPIGWDDLGAYMNFPKIVAENGTLGNLGILAWQSFTAIGFLFHSAPQAFFLNQVGGILSLVFIVLSVRRLLSAESTKQHFLHIPLMMAALFYALPMIVFQQAKDMKLDPALFALSVASIFLLFEAVRRPKEYAKDIWKLFAISGFVAGIAFAIKFTTLMLFLWGAAVIFYTGLWLAGFYGFFALFVGIFTKLGLWSLLNVNYPKDDPAFLSLVSISAFGIAALFLGYAFHKARKIATKAVLIPLGAFGIAAFVAFSPWIIKNAFEISSAKVPFSIPVLLGGVVDTYPVDYTTIRSKEAIEEITKRTSRAGMSASGTTTNEDLGRYFGYEDGINNYLKLPFNLTYQKNQPGEYTEISFVFLALLPGIFLFLSYRHPAFALASALTIVFEYLYFFNPNTSAAISGIFGKMLLPGGYALIATVLLAPLAYFHYTLDRKDTRNELFLVNMAFLAFYGFIFVISAYGIVWYGIAAYFSMLLAISIGADDVSEISETPSWEGTRIAKFIASLVLFATIALYLGNSAIPHGWNNFRSAGFEEFKAGRLSQEEAIFASHPDYLKILAVLNLKDLPRTMEEVLSIAKTDPTTKQIAESNKIENTSDIESIHQFLNQLANTKASAIPKVKEELVLAMNNSAKKARTLLYDRVLYPPKDQRNDAPIYRIGTFLTYFITDNRKRYVDDSLVQNFDDYFYDEDTKITVDRLKKIGIKYFLIDLNAATIDRDPRHDLTRRYENLLKTFRSEKLGLVKTDSFCLESAMELNSQWRPLEEYLSLAWVNYESYTASGVIYRTQKQNACHRFFANLIESGKIESHPYLTAIDRYIQSGKKSGSITTNEDVLTVLKSVVGHGWVALFEVQ